MPKKLDPLPDRIKAVLKETFKNEPDTIIDVTPSGVRDNLHVLVVSRRLDPLTEQQKQELLWGALDTAKEDGKLSDMDVLRVSMILPVSVSELRR